MKQSDGILLFTANTVVQKFLSTLSSGTKDKDEDKMLIPLQYVYQFLRLLVNPSVTEINCSGFDCYKSSRNVHNFLLRHALENCPKISKVTFMDKGLCRYPKSGEILPVERFKRSWNNLTSIKTHNDLICKEDTLKFIQQNFPNIESV
jgi:hypothetical protein